MKQYTEYYTFRLSKKEKEYLRILHDMYNVNIGRFIRKAIENEIKKEVPKLREKYKEKFKCPF